MEDIAQTMSKVSGKTVKYQQISEEELRPLLPPWADTMIEMMLYLQDFGCYGPQTKELVAWAAENARGQPTTLEQYLTEHPLPLQ